MRSDRPLTLPLLAEGASRLGFDLSERQLEQFKLYYGTLLGWNSRINLTAITDYEGVQVRHFLDSLTVGAALLRDLTDEGRPIGEPPEGFALMDIGTGAGFPGVPLKILWPGLRLALADSIGKKTAFLKELVGVLEFDNVQVVTARAEELGRNKPHRERYGVVTARAVASLPVLCEYCLPLAEVGGRMLAPKKGDISQELRDEKRAARLLGGGEPWLYHFTLPGGTEEGEVVVVRKVSATTAG